MRNQYSISLLCLCLVACQAESQNGPSNVAGGLQNLLVDPGFENADPAWQHLDDGGRSTVSSPVHSGIWAAEIQLSSQFDREIFQVVGILPATLYNAGGWVKTSGVNGNGGLIELYWIDSSGATVQVDRVATVIGTQDWTSFSGSYAAPPSAVDVKLRVSGSVESDGVGMVWFDDLELIGAPGSSSPTVAFSTYVGGSQDETLRDTAFDDQGNFYVVGGTASANFPTTPGAYDTTLNTSGSLVHDVAVMKLSSNGVVVWSTLIGGPEYDRAYAVEVDDQGYVYVAGRAGLGFPTTPGVVQPNFAGDGNPNSLYGPQDGFVTKLSPDGSQVIWSTYFGGDDRSFIRDMDIDDSGNVYVVMPVVTRPVSHITAGAFQTNLPPGRNGVVAKISSDGTQVIWATYLGASDIDMGTPSVRVNDSGEVIVAGATNSPDMPTTLGAHDRTINGSFDMYVAKLSADGSQLVFGTYVGGSQSEFSETHGLALDSSGNVVLAATTKSTNLGFPAGAFQIAYGGSGGSGTGAQTNYPGDGFIVILSGDVGSFMAGTYLGGNQGEGLEGVMLDAVDNVYVTGVTYSDNFPTTFGAFQVNRAGDADFFAAKLSPDLTELVYGTYIGGSGKDFCRSSSVDAAGNFYICGHTDSDDWPKVNAFQTVRGGAEDGVVMLLRTGSANCALGDGTPCDDGDPCTTDDVCNSGVCAGTPTDCSSLNGPCKTGTCDAPTGQCQAVAVGNGQACDADGDTCTIGGLCSAGVCVGEQALNCDDGVACTIDSCLAGACVHSANDTLCSEDGLFCTGAALCDPIGGCTSSGNPCLNPFNCDEGSDSCGCEAPGVVTEGPRYFAVTAPYSQTDVALKVTGVDPGVSCVVGFVQADGTLGDNPVYRPANGVGGWGTIHIHGLQLLAGMTYQIQADCDASQPGSEVSAYTPATLWLWGDVDDNASVDIIDITRVVDGFRGSMHATTVCVTDADCSQVQPNRQCDGSTGRCLRIALQNIDLTGAGFCGPDGLIDIMDITNDIDAFRGLSGPCVQPCP